MLPPDVSQHFVSLRGSKPEESELVYGPMLLGSSQIRFSDSKSGIDTTQDMTVLASITDGPVPVVWDKATGADLAVSDLEQTPAEGAQFLALPTTAGQGQELHRVEQGI